MRRPWKAGGVIVGLAVLLSGAGCLFRGTGERTSGWLDRLRTPPDGLHIRTELIDQPAGSQFLNKGLWVTAGKLVSHEQATLLAQNGVRVGVLTGMIPGEFEQIVSSEQATIDPTYRSLQPGQPKVVPVNGPIDRCSFQVLHDLAADPVRMDLTAAECGLAVTARPVDGGKVKLLCELQLQHGDKQAYLTSSADGSGFSRKDHKPLETFPTLSWEATVGPGDYLVVGASDDPAGTLGQQFFFTPTGAQMRQRVLVIRAGRGSTPTGPVSPTATRTTAAAAGRQTITPHGDER